MKKLLFKAFAAVACLATAGLTVSCDMMEQDLSDCPYGLYLTFKYDYNLERADMFNDHVGSVTLYVFDESGKLVKTQEESNLPGNAPLKDKAYSMHITDLAPGRYRFIALAGQRPYADMMEDSRARFVRTDMTVGADMESLSVQLDRTQTGADTYDIVNNSLPLDTLWHGMLTEPVEVYAVNSNKASYATVSLVRDTKKINVTLRELDDPTQMDIGNYDMKITDRNSTLLYDNSVDETTGTVVYRPHATWNSDDRQPSFDAEGNPVGDIGHIGHADFMTSRIIYHDNAADDGILSITNRQTGMEVARLNLPDILSRLANYDDTQRYTPQEFLDRGYDYSLDIFLRGDKLSYVNISVSVNMLSWSKRIQFEEL